MGVRISPPVQAYQKIIMNKVVLFVKDSFSELRTKVSWPKYNELQNSTTLVLVASIIFALLIGGVDSVFDLVMNWFYQSF